MKCLRCGAAMYRVVNADQSAKATCSGCSQWLDCARCSSASCGDVKCLKCWNKAAVGAPAKSSAPLVSDDSEL